MKRTQQQAKATRARKRRATETVRRLDATPLAAVRGGTRDETRWHASHKVDIHENQHNETLVRL